MKTSHCVIFTFSYQTEETINLVLAFLAITYWSAQIQVKVIVFLIGKGIVIIHRARLFKQNSMVREQ